MKEKLKQLCVVKNSFVVFFAQNYWNTLQNFTGNFGLGPKFLAQESLAYIYKNSQRFLRLKESKDK